MKYNEFIDGILSSRGRFNCNGYCERHHIKPKCIGGENNEENLIDLYPSEHYIAHRLLAEENPDINGLIRAWWIMCNGVTNNGNRAITNAKEYEMARLAYISVISEEYKGEGNPNFGKHHSDETKRKISEKAKMRICSEETKQMLRTMNIGKPCSEERKEHIRQANIGHFVSDDTKDKIAKSRVGKYSGSENPNARKVQCDGVIYDCIVDCAMAYGLKPSAMYSYLGSKNKMPKKFKKLNLSYVR